MSHFSDYAPPQNALPERFRVFARTEAQRLSPLYAAMALACAENPEALALAATREPSQPPVNMLFGAIHLLLLAGDAHPLRGWFPDLTPEPAPAAAVGPALADFLRARGAALAPIVASRRVSTNEPARAAGLWIAIDAGLRRLEALGLRADALALLDVGASAGLTLRPDRARVDFGAGRVAGPADAPLRFAVTLDPEGAAPPRALPPIVWRAGLDTHPLDPASPEDAAWLRALIWPEMAERVARLEAALALARAEPAPLVRGDAVRDGPALACAAPPEALLCVTHSMTMNQWPNAARRSFHEALKGVSASRPVLRASLEWREGDRNPSLHASAYRDGAQIFRAAVAWSDGHCGRVRLVG